MVEVEVSTLWNVKKLKEAIVIKVRTERENGNANHWPESLDPQSITLLFSGAELEDTRIIQQIQNLGTGQTILLTPRRLNNANNMQDPAERNRRQQLGAVATQLRHVNVLQRNTEACVRAAQLGSGKIIMIIIVI